MTINVDAVYENGVLTLKEPIDLPEGRGPCDDSDGCRTEDASRTPTARAAFGDHQFGARATERGWDRAFKTIHL